MQKVGVGFPSTFRFQRPGGWVGGALRLAWGAHGADG